MNRLPHIFTSRPSLLAVALLASSLPHGALYGNLDYSAATPATRPTDLRILARDFLLALRPQPYKQRTRFPINLGQIQAADLRIRGVTPLSLRSIGNVDRAPIILNNRSEEKGVGELAVGYNSDYKRRVRP